MGIKKAQFIIKGMSRDLAASKFNPELAYENMNMRLVATDNNTTLVLTNEKGTQAATIITPGGAPASSIAGIPIGQCILNNKLILFTTPGESVSGRDCIYKFWFDNNTLKGESLYAGNLGFSIEHPIETLGMYENEALQKVYWVDGLNQPRVINIEASSTEKSRWNDDSFNFIKSIDLLHTNVNINRDGATSGLFAPGVIQYCMTYYNLYGQESNIFYTSPLYYVTYTDRAGSPDEHISNSFKLTITGPDVNFDYIRVYSILRTSLDATPQVRKVVDLAVNRDLTASQTITYIDNGTEGQSIDPTTLFFIGGESLVAGTLSQKDNTLFLGDIKYDKLVLDASLQEQLKIDQGQGVSSVWSNAGFTYSEDTADRYNILGNFGGYYNYTNQLLDNSTKIKGFKYKEWYRFGIQLQHLNGKWCSPVWIGDAENNVPMETKIFDGSYDSPASTVRYPEYRATISGTILSTLYEQGYRKIRPVVVFPSIVERESICQGVLCPTVYNLEDRFGNIPFAQSSWFFRPDPPVSPTDSYTEVDRGSVANYGHNSPLGSNHERNGEVQCMCYGLGNNGTWSDPATIWCNDTSNEGKLKFVSSNKENFFIDRSIVTLHSPELEFDSRVKTLNFSDFNLRIIGAVPITSLVSNIDIQVSTPTMIISGKKERETNPNADTAFRLGFYSEPVGTSNASQQGWRQLISAPMWIDGCHGQKAYPKNGDFGWMYVVYPWQKTGSLNNTKSPESGEEVSSKLLHKVLANSRFSYNTLYYTNPSDFWDPSNMEGCNGISGVELFESNEVSPVKLPAQGSDLSEIIYYGNIDKVVVYPAVEKKKDGYPIMVANYIDSVSHDLTPHDLYKSNYIHIKRDPALDESSIIEITAENTSTSPISIKYKSTPHAVLAFNTITDTSTNPNRVYSTSLPIAVSYSSFSDHTDFFDSKRICWDKKNIINGYRQWYRKLPVDGVTSDARFGYLWLGELYRTVNTNTIFGGKTQEAFENNQWEIAGEGTLLNENNLQSSITIRWTEGDTYYQRYDCLKTYPFTHEDLNSVVDVLSFMCETRINIDGRYDKNRGQTNNLYISPNNFNLLNPVYSQHNNFFNYRAVNLDKLKLTSFPNSITWTKTKTLGEEVDTWTNINLASILDLDGDKGPVRAIKKFNDSLLTFQDESISQVLYNENVQIASTTGVPIEIANSGKVTGKRAISNHVGCTNKWSICSTPNGLYFVDDRTKDIYLFNGQMENISDKLGFHSWMVQNFEGVKTWNPVNFDSCITYYDKINQDVLFITKNTALAFNENLNNFTSFYSYEKVPFFGYLGDKAIMWQKDNNNLYKPWLYREGSYNMFFGQFKPYWTTVVVNPDPAFDKVFNNVEFRADSFDPSNSNALVSSHTFDHLYAWNEHQNSSCTLNNTKDLPSTLKKKFRIWHAAIPRQIISQDFIRRDRIRNPWTYLKLSTEVSNTYKTVLHDMIVDYFE